MATKLLAAGLILLPCAAWPQALPPIERTFANGGTLRFYGQIDKGVLNYDDGAETETYGLIDNDNSSTRAGLSYKQPLGAWTFENVNEIQYAPYSSSNANILNTSPDAEDYDFTNANIRKLDFTLANDRYGKLWLGQGSMATDGITEIDLSGTDVVAYSSVGDSAGGQLLRLADGALADPEIRIGDVYANYDGDRRVRVRYDTRDFNGFTAAAGFGRDLLSDDADKREENVADASLSYAGTFDDIEVKAGLGYYWQENDATIWGGSASALHTPTGLNLTFAAANQDDDGDTGAFWYGKLGLLRDFVAWGPTAASIDYYAGEDLFLDAATGITSSTSDSWSLALVQSIDRVNTELWLTWRSYDYADDFASYDDGRAIFGGARFRF